MNCRSSGSIHLNELTDKDTYGSAGIPVRPPSTNTHLPSTSPLMVFCQRGGGLECPSIWDTGGDAFAGAPGRAKPSPTICAGTPSGVERQQVFHDISKTIRTTGSHVRVPDTRTDRQKIGLGHRHRWLCRAGDRRLALRAVRREHHIRPADQGRPRSAASRIAEAIETQRI
jgi:hypothetical protein